MKGKQIMALLLILINFYSNSCQEQNITSVLDEDVLDLKTYIKNYKTEINEMEEEYNNYKQLIKKSKKRELLNDLEQKKGIINYSKNELTRISEYYENLKLDYKKDKIAGYGVFKNYREEMKKRKNNGVSEMNKLLSNFLYPTKTKESLELIISILGQNDTDII